MMRTIFVPAARALHTAASSKSGAHGFARAALVFSLSGFFVWHLISKQLPSYLALHSPETALLLDPTHPAALVALADKELNARKAPSGAQLETMETGSGAQRLHFSTVWHAAAAEDGIPALSASEPIRIGDMARAALQRDPLNAKALQILGQLADATGDEESARRFMAASAQLSMRSTYAVYWLAIDAARRADYTSSVGWLDLLLRKRPAMQEHVYPLLAQFAELNETARGSLVDSLAAEPPWRTSFLANLPQQVRDTHLPFAILLALSDSAAPPTPGETNNYVRFLVRNNEHVFAYYVWLQSLEPEALSGIGLLVNGGFDREPSGAPFDWTISPHAGVTIEIADRFDADGGRALLLDFGPGRADVRGVSQFLALSPGRYRLSGRLQGEAVSSHGLAWRIQCWPSRKIAGETPAFLGEAPRWTEFAAEFLVAGDDCPVQQLALRHDARSASEQFIFGTVWYDSLAVHRLDDELRGIPSRR